MLSIVGLRKISEDFSKTKNKTLDSDFIRPNPKSNDNTISLELRSSKVTHYRQRPKPTGCFYEKKLLTEKIVMKTKTETKSV